MEERMNERILAISCALGLVACGRPQKTQSTAVVVSAAASSSPDAAASAGGSQPVSSPFVVVGRFAKEVDAQLHALGDRPAVRQRNAEGSWGLSALTRDGRIVDLASKLTPAQRSGDVLTVAGDGPDRAFVSTYFVTAEGAMQFDMSTWQMGDGKAPTQAAPVAFRAMGELHDGHWVGLPFAVHPGYLLDDPPQKLRTFRGKGSLPTIAPKLSLYQLAFLGGGKACGVGAVVGDKDALRTRLWTDDGATFPLELTDVEQARVLRGSGGECVLVAPGGSGTTFVRVRGGALTKVESRRRARAVTASRDGAVWLLDEEDDVVVRVRLREDATDETVFAMPSSQGECKLRPRSIVAFADDDVWLTADCSGGAQTLLHTQTAPAKVETWPAPPVEPAAQP
jgi:hypothetical protein